MFEPMSLDPAARLAEAQKTFDFRMKIADAVFKFFTWTAITASLIVAADKFQAPVFGCLGLILFMVMLWPAASIFQLIGAKYIKPEAESNTAFAFSLVTYLIFAVIACLLIKGMIEIVNGFILVSGKIKT